MGLSFHYNGIFDPNASLPDLIDEVKDVARTYNWSYLVYETEFLPNSLGKTRFNDKLYGISIAPPQCEPLYICFLSNGRMSSSDNLTFWGRSTEPADLQYLYLLSTKTQYAGYEAHIILIKLLKYISKKYFFELVVIDEGQYWETGDKTILKANFEQSANILNSFSAAVESFPFREGETMDEYIERMMAFVNKSNRNSEL